MFTSVLLVSALLTSTAAPAAAEAPVRFLGEHVLPMGLEVDGSAVGGLSGLDYDHRTRKWIIISDDRVAPRFFEADLSREGVRFTGVRTLNADGGPYAPGVVDPEDVRVDRWTGDVVWSQEGSRTADVLSDPFVQFNKRDGAFRRTLPLPEDLKMRPESGPRGNASLEGLTFAAGGTRVVSAVEGPLLQDGPPADQQSGAVSRVVVQSRQGRVLEQYRYRQEPLFAPGADTGVVAILEKSHGVYLVLERSFAQGVGNKVRLFEARPDGSSLRKRLLADLDDFPLSKVDNVEGMAWGPDGTLWLVSDNNFSSTQITQFIALDVR